MITNLRELEKYVEEEIKKEIEILKKQQAHERLLYAQGAIKALEKLLEQIKT